MNYKELYIQYGRLIYSVAKADGQVRPEETVKIMQLIKEEMTQFENSTDEFGTDNAYYAEFEFERLMESKCESDTAFQSFLHFSRSHSRFFTDSVKGFATSLAEKVALSHGGVSSSEHSLIRKLKKHLENI